MALAFRQPLRSFAACSLRFDPSTAGGGGDAGMRSWISALPVCVERLLSESCTGSTCYPEPKEPRGMYHWGKGRGFSCSELSR